MVVAIWKKRLHVFLLFDCVNKNNNYKKTIIIKKKRMRETKTKQPRQNFLTAIFAMQYIHPI